MLETDKQRSDRIKRQKLYEGINKYSGAVALVIALSLFLMIPMYVKREAYTSEIAQLFMDEGGVVLKRYEDSLGNNTIGVGHLITSTENYEEVTYDQALAILRVDYNTARDGVERLQPWAEGDVKLVLINMHYQMGATGVLGFKDTLRYMEQKDYPKAAAAMLDSVWAEEVSGNRANRLASRILALDDSW